MSEKMRRCAPPPRTAYVHAHEPSREAHSVPCDVAREPHTRITITHSRSLASLGLSPSLLSGSHSGLCALVCPAVGDQEGVCACVVGEGESWYTIGLNNPPHTGQPATITRSPGTQGAVDSTSMAETADKRSRCAQCTGGAPTS